MFSSANYTNMQTKAKTYKQKKQKNLSILDHYNIQTVKVKGCIYGPDGLIRQLRPHVTHSTRHICIFY